MEKTIKEKILLVIKKVADVIEGERMTVTEIHSLEAESWNNGFEEGLEKGKRIGRERAIEEYQKELHDMIEDNDQLTDWQKHEILECNELVAEQLKETE